MIRTALALSLAFATPVTAGVAGTRIDEQLNHCARFSEMMQAAAEARYEYDGLVAAIRRIPDRLEIQEFGFERLFIQKAMLQIERLHGQLTPEQIGEAMAASCVETMSGISS